MSFYPLLVEVIWADLDQGEPGDACRCPLALAINRALRGAGIGYREAAVGAHCVDLYPGSVRLSLPPVAREFVADVDYLCDPRPISFELEIPT